VFVELHAPLRGDGGTTIWGTTQCRGCRGRAAAGGAGRTVATAAQVATVIRQRVQHGMHLSIPQGVLLVQAISSS